MKKTCQYCGKEFEPKHGGNRRMACYSKSCEAQHKERVRLQHIKTMEAYRARDGSPKKWNGWHCRRCGEPLTGAYRFNCPECLDKYSRTQQRVDGDWVYEDPGISTGELMYG